MFPALRFVFRRAMTPVSQLRSPGRHHLYAPAAFETFTLKRLVTNLKEHRSGNFRHMISNAFTPNRPTFASVVLSKGTGGSLNSQGWQQSAAGSVDAAVHDSATSASQVTTNMNSQQRQSSGSDTSVSGGANVDTQSSGSASVPGSDQSLMLMSGAYDMPHPEKVHKGGEDAHYIADNYMSIGVADGVGGWAEAGIDAGIYARLLMSEAKKVADSGSAAGMDPRQVLKLAHMQTKVQGSSTACIVCLNKATLHAANLGDSGFMVVRDGKLAFQSPQQQHSFNFPFQISSESTTGDQPDSAMVFEVGVQPGDILIAGTDGLLDNVFAEEIAVIASLCKKRGGTATETARVLTEYARMRAADPQYISPFAYGAFQAGHIFQGGKMDDITVVVAYVVPASKL